MRGAAISFASGGRFAAERFDRALVGGVAAAALVFLMLPIVIVTIMSFSSASTLAFPPPGLSLRWYLSFFGNERWLAAALNSMIVALSASTLALLLATPAAYGLARGRFRGKGLFEANFIAPLIVPPVVKAVALYILYAQIGLLGTYAGLIIAHTILAVPYVILVMSIAVRSLDFRLEQVARTLGASQFRIFRRVILPNLAPSVLAAWVMAFIVSFDEIIITFFVFGNRETLPKRMFTQLEQKIDPTITAIASILILTSVATLAAVGLLMRRGNVTPMQVFRSP